ncbi:hypothetical protein P6U16_03685 [Rhizobium sp. 32-5/1]|uniref:hypothetical protein n=1 Tax=Rhizobium sp. 32-5/1 TaxID=3019602 RepID=UPI00240DA1BA|nr:hypothetical protein [Rhizobium sp. 32-5/1]WEZ83874.1 hypothetical protein P6U16_03685 [Rhizobium sp. 32-5/1]
MKMSAETPDAAESRAGIHATVIGTSLEPEFSFLNTYLNQTGDFKSPAKAATAVKTAVEEEKSGATARSMPPG